MQETACNTVDPGSISVLGRSRGEENGNPLQYSYLESPMDRGDGWATVHGIARVRPDWVTKPPPEYKMGLGETHPLQGFLRGKGTTFPLEVVAPGGTWPDWHVHFGSTPKTESQGLSTDVDSPTKDIDWGGDVSLWHRCMIYLIVASMGCYCSSWGLECTPSSYAAQV